MQSIHTYKSDLELVQVLVVSQVFEDTQDWVQ